METLLQDARLSVRRLRKTPTFTLTTILLLALGIGATTSIFTLAYAVLFKSLAVANPNDLYRLGKQAQCCVWSGYSQANGFSMVSYDLYKHFRDHTEGFAELAGFQASESLFGVRRSGESEAAQSYGGEFVSGNYFAMFGIHAYAGRMFTSRDDQPGAPAALVMSYRLWQQRYRSDPSIIGSEFDIDAKPFTLIGITPPGFFGDRLRSDPPDFYLPLNTEPAMDANADLNKPDVSWLDLIGRKKPGVKPMVLEAQMRVHLKQWLRSHWSDMSANDRTLFPEQTLFLEPGGAGITSMRDQYEHWLHILIMVSGFVLLIVCANVANLMLVRGMQRRSQISLSMALGAPALRLVRQVLTESLLLSLLGGAAGLATAFAGTRLILRFAFPIQNGGMPGIPIDAEPSAPVLLFAFAVALLTGVIFGIAPAWMTVRAAPIDALRGASRSVGVTSSGQAGSLLRKALVVSQAALSLVLLSASGLLTIVLYRLETQDLGAEQNRRIVAKTNPRLAGYQPEQLTPLYRRIHDTLSSIPGVSAVALCSYAPLTVSAWGADIVVDGHPPPGPKDENFAVLNRVTPGFFAVIGTPLVRGRGISEQDTASSQHAAVINEAFAHKFFPHEDPIGKHFGRWAGGAAQYQIVGIAKDARYWVSDLGKRPTPGVFLPESQHDLRPNVAGEVSPGTHFLNDIVLVTRPGVILPSDRVRRALASIDPNLPIISIQSLSERVAEQFVPQRLIARLTSCFGLLSLVLAAIGLYGVTAYNATQRVNEIGVRMALGATRGDVVALVLRGAFGLIVLGLILGLPLTLAAGRFLGNQLYGMDPYNPLVLCAAAFALAVSALIASLIPAFRACSISPLEALRPE